ncbi:hypothetical protein ACH5RR_000602 [Cinchona calisaya]|uniref:Uncharacterized protein n=1 Tax=Cinchona calisaya TaxID=153742 RepID=A0ABD3B1D9_9GENT
MQCSGWYYYDVLIVPSAIPLKESGYLVMAGPRCHRSMKQPTNTKSFASTIPLENDHASNTGVSSTIVEASENVLLENDTNTGVSSTWWRHLKMLKMFQEKSIRNSKNRACLTTLPKSGYVSLLAYQYEEGCGNIDYCKGEFTDKNGNWVDEEHEDKYKKMKFELEQAIETGVPMNVAAICAKHLGTTSGYIRATKKFDETGVDLAVVKKKLNRQHNMIDWMKDIVIEKFGMTLSTLCSDDEFDDGK